MPAAVKYRDMWVQVIIFIVTLGIYSIYWFYVTTEEMKQMADDRDVSPALLTVLLFIPFAGLYSFYKQGELFQKVGQEKLNRWIIFILWLVFSPAVWFIIQSDLNRHATYNRPVQG
jgi:fatty acid desaturase